MAKHGKDMRAWQPLPSPPCIGSVEALASHRCLCQLPWFCHVGGRVCCGYAMSWPCLCHDKAKTDIAKTGQSHHAAWQKHGKDMAMTTWQGYGNVCHVFAMSLPCLPCFPCFAMHLPCCGCGVPCFGYALATPLPSLPFFCLAVALVCRRQRA
jgi:hypothetical protein